MLEDKNLTPNGAEANDSTEETKWTIIVYLAGDNNLADECVYALTEMKSVDTGTRIKVVAQFDPNGRRIRTRRFVINQGQQASRAPGVTGDSPRWDNGGSRRPGKIIEDALDEIEEGEVKFPGAAQGRTPPQGVAAMTDSNSADVNVDDGEQDTGDPKPLFDLISWSVEHHPADHYMVILGGHGAGTVANFLRDESSQGTLSIAELGQVFAAVRSELKDKAGAPLVIDILGMDSCLMSMAEVCHELHGSVKYMVSSESFGPQSGWPYRRILERLNTAIQTNGDASAQELASFIVKEHVDFYVEYSATDGLSVDISMIDVARADDLANEIKKLAAVLTGELEAGEALKALQRPSDFLDRIVLAHWEAQSYNSELFVDLYDFCDCLRRRYDPALVPPAPESDAQAVSEREQVVSARDAVRRGCESVMNVVKALVRQSCYTGIDFQYSNGVSIYFPWAEVASDYTARHLKFVEASGWRDFLDTYVRATRREPRGLQRNDRTLLEFTRMVRRTPLDGRGLVNLLVNSMRNPPITLVEGGLSACTQQQEDAPLLIETLALRSQ